MSENPTVPEPTAVPEGTAVPESTAAPEPAAVREGAAVPESTAVPEGTAVPEPAAVPEGTGVPQPGKALRRRGRVAAVASGILLALAVLGGAGYTVVTVKNADRDAGAPEWKFPKPEAERNDKGGTRGAPGQPAVASGLAAMLVPYDRDKFGRGPDLGEFGSDVILSGERATALRKERLAGMPRSARQRMEKEIDRQRLTGMAIRSYQSPAGTAGGTPEEIFTMSIELVRMENRLVARNRARMSELLEDMDVFRKGPRIKGHKNARCFLPPKGGEAVDLDMMICTAYVGDVLVTATATGAAPLNTKGAATLLRKQLDRIKEPGKAI